MQVKFRKVHRYISIIFSIFILSLSVTGIILNHPDLIPSPKEPKDTIIDICSLTNKQSYLVLSDVGLFKYNEQTKKFSKITVPYPTKKASQLVKHGDTIWVILDQGVILTTTESQLGIWQRLNLPSNIQSIQHASYSKSNGLIIKTSTGVYEEHPTEKWKKLIPYETKTSLIKALHTGEIFQPILRPINDLTGIALIILIITGVTIFFRRPSRKSK